MPNVLIVSRTRMGGGNVCIGGFDLTANRNIRLLTAQGGNQPGTTPYQVGQVWNLTYINKPLITAPHVEDVLVQSGQHVSSHTQASLASFIALNCPLVQGSLSSLFGGHVHSHYHAASFIDNTGIPNHSVCFWRVNSDLTLVNVFDKNKYHYVSSGYDTFFAYVGVEPPIPVIRNGTIVRMSLARWWTPPNSQTSACYLQLSGWY